MIRSILSACLLCSSLAAQPTPVDTSKIRTAILSVIERQVNGWNNGSVDEFMDGYARTDSLRFASGGSVTYGWKPMLERYKSRYTTKEAMGILVFSNVSVSIISNDAALVFGKWTLKRKNDTPQGLFTLLFRMIDGEWRIVHDHTSSTE
ncbi:MAG: nuclear transport factor 2 family protein [Ignavibacteriales bacterium]|nr:nuclear transport factor 2 family protein [Ignavibacteriales bacterium]